VGQVMFLIRYTDEKIHTEVSTASEPKKEKKDWKFDWKKEGRLKRLLTLLAEQEKKRQ